jgi:glycine/D-amino acid oxidase-like deaminating enzyme/nitrite reductase/ring-hydroxylating ferredoxin subunit
MKSSERSVSVWEATRPQQEFAPLVGETDADVCVVGAGIAGMTTAYLLAKAGKRVVVLDHASVGGGETGQTTAHLSSALDDYYHVLESVHGERGARLAYASHQAAIEKIGNIVGVEGIDCDYLRVDGYWFQGPNEDPDFLEKERDAARRAGAVDVELVDRIPGVPFDSGPALRFPRQGQFHILKYLEGLARCILRDGGRIHTGNHVDEVEGGARTRVAGKGFAVTAGATVVCTNPPISDWVTLHSKQAPYRTYVVAARVPKDAVPPILFWDTLESYHYCRTQPIPDDPAHVWLMVGGEDHKQAHGDEDAPGRYAKLEAWTRERFPVVSVDHRWSGMVMEPFDFMAFIGRDPSGFENVYVTTGDSGHGMTHGTIGGMLNSDLILGIPNEWETLYEPSRKTISRHSVMDYVQENVDVAVQLVAGHAPTGGDVKSADEIAPGTGAILQEGLKKVAAYRDESGVLHRRSAACTHLGCVVEWNKEEASWDCPCHGSRFGPTGEVLTGPARTPLKSLDGEGS